MHPIITITIPTGTTNVTWVTLQENSQLATTQQAEQVEKLAGAQASDTWTTTENSHSTTHFAIDTPTVDTLQEIFNTAHLGNKFNRFPTPEGTVEITIAR